MPLYLTDNGQTMDKMAAFFDGYRACLDDICDRVGAAVIIAAVPVKIGGLPRRRGQEKIIVFALFILHASASFRAGYSTVSIPHKGKTKRKRLSEILYHSFLIFATANSIF